MTVPSGEEVSSFKFLVSRIRHAQEMGQQTGGFAAEKDAERANGFIQQYSCIVSSRREVH